jgi:cysteinyl-tRNA synthetase
MLKIYNTLTRSQEEFVPIVQNKVSFYHCGPTVYWTQHIGNMRGMTMADLIRRSLDYLGYDVMFVRNYTDVGHLTGDNLGDADTGEDRMEKASKREQLDPQTIAKKYVEIFEKDIKTLNIIEPDHKPVASAYISEMQEMVRVLLEKDYAYLTPKAVYFDVNKFPDYTKLNGQNLEKNITGEGKGDVGDPEKKNPYDFALWFFKTGVHKNALQYWPSIFNSTEVTNGEGFPGWHIECSAMSKALLGDTIDFHMGGIEHISIHHTNEIAQSEAANGVKFVNYWLHNEHLLIDGGKMSKSSGTAYTIEDIVAKDYDPIVLRYFFLNAHYRSKQNFTWEALEGSNQAYQRLKNQVSHIVNSQTGLGEVNNEYKDRFIRAIENDFNIPEALALLWELIKSDMNNDEKLATINDFDKVLGLKLTEVVKLHLTDEIQDLLEKRELARKLKNWTEADQIREQLESQYAVVVKDTPEGQRVQ